MNDCIHVAYPICKKVVGLSRSIWKLDFIEKSLDTSIDYDLRENNVGNRCALLSYFIITIANLRQTARASLV